MHICYVYNDDRLNWVMKVKRKNIFFVRFITIIFRLLGEIQFFYKFIYLFIKTSKNGSNPIFLNFWITAWLHKKHFVLGFYFLLFAGGTWFSFLPLFLVPKMRCNLFPCLALSVSIFESGLLLDETLFPLFRVEKIRPRPFFFTAVSSSLTCWFAGLDSVWGSILMWVGCC